MGLMPVNRHGPVTDPLEDMMPQPTGAKSTVVIEMRDGEPTIILNSVGRNYAADKLMIMKLVQASINSQSFPKATNIESS